MCYKRASLESSFGKPLRKKRSKVCCAVVVIETFERIKFCVRLGSATISVVVTYSDSQRMSQQMHDFAVHFLFGNLRFSTKMHDFAVNFFFENQRFSAEMHDFAVHFLFGNRRFSTKMRDFAVT